jgi:hypothetical protein
VLDAAGSRSTSRDFNRHTTAASLSFLITLAFIFFLPIASGHTFSTVAGRQVSVYPWRALDPVFPDYPQNDQADLSYPWQTFLTRSVRTGTLPFWNPYAFGGQPFFANGSSAVLYPPKLLTAALVSPSWAHDLLSILHVVLAGVGMWLLLRELGYSWAPALLGGVAWMFCPFNMSWLQLEVVAPSAAWLPVSCFLIHRAITRSSWRWTLAAAAALACALVSGHLLFMALVYAVALFYGITLILPRLLANDHGRRSPLLLRLLVLAVVPLTLSAIVLVPTVVFLRSLGRQSLPYELAHEGIRLPYEAFAHLLVPPPAAPITELEMHQMAYVGRLVAILAMVGFFSRQRGTWFARILTIATFLIATDTIVLQWCYRLLPQFSFFSPLGRLLNFFDFGVILLGAAGLETVLRLLRWRGSSNVSVAWTRASFAMALLILGVTAGELVAYARKVNPAFPPREDRFSFPRTPLIRRLSQELVGHNGPGRMIPIRRSLDAFSPPILSANEAMLFEFESVAGWDSTLPNRAETLWKIVAGEPVDAVLAETYRRAFWASFDVARCRFDLLPRLGVTTIVAAPEVGDDPLWQQRRDTSGLTLQAIYTGVDGRLYRIHGVEGGPVLVGRPARAATSLEALDTLRSPRFADRREAVFEIADVPVSWRNHGVAPAEGSARVLTKTINTEEIEVHSASDAWVVIPTNWDAGWSARIDGEAVPVVRANYTFQAVPVPAGRRRLVLTYRPRGLVVGAVISASSIVLAVIVVSVPRRRADTLGVSA